MSSRTIPYHLRQNKAVDRYAFIELLAKIDRFSPINTYRYIGFGGHSLEEFKYLHDRFALSKMTSIETDKNIFERQNFNLPYSCIELENQTSESFFNAYDRQDPTIIWLDYTDPKKIKQQIEEFQDVLEKLEPLDIIKITLNANAASYYNKDGSSNIHNERLEKIREILGEELFPSADISVELMKTNKFPYALMFILKYAANLVLNNSACCFQSLTCFSYADGQTMMTVTGIILEKAEVEFFLKQTKLNNWEIKNTDWSEPRSIDIPDFTIRERLFIDRLLPKETASEIQTQLKFHFGKKSESESLKMLENYILFYRQSPYFSRIVI